jgi:serine/threonine protein kinase
LKQTQDHGHVGKYDLLRKLGSGSSGVVRLAIDRTSPTKRKKAIKIIPKGNVSNMSRIDTEIKAMMMLEHPSIVKLEEVLENEESVYFVMELCGGGNIADIIDTDGVKTTQISFFFFFF